MTGNASSRLLLVSTLLYCHVWICRSLASTPVLRFFIGGLGYCGSRIALRLRQEFPDCEIAGCVRSKARKESLVYSSWEGKSYVLDLDEEYRGLEEEGLQFLSKATHIIQTIAPIADYDRDPLLALHGSTLQKSNDLIWVGYLSSTGVYGDHGGEWVDERSELRCQDAKSLARVKAEREWRHLEESRYQSDKKTRIDCFRCGGIYGPSRGPMFSPSLKAALIEDHPPQDNSSSVSPKYVNRILVDDICGAIVSAVKANILEPVGDGKIYNLVDDDPAPRREVIEEAKRLVFGSSENLEAIASTESAQATSSRRRQSSRNTGNKRCRNQLLKDDYKWEPVAPTYREGLALLWQQQALKL